MGGTKSWGFSILFIFNIWRFPVFEGGNGRIYLYILKDIYFTYVKFLSILLQKASFGNSLPYYQKEKLHLFHLLYSVLFPQHWGKYLVDG